MKKIALLLPLLAAAPAFADGPHFHADLIGFQEVPSISTQATGTFSGVTAGDWTSIDWELSFDGLQGPVTQAHIHFAQKSVTGPIVIWLCGTPALPGPAGTQPCPQSGTIKGTITSANVLASPATQQLRAGAIGDIIVAMDSGFAYANIHTGVSPGGEIRGQINPQKSF
ncbi:MAG: CHRD domain-containing protein [Usitatibacter sp.]